MTDRKAFMTRLRTFFGTTVTAYEIRDAWNSELQSLPDHLFVKISRGIKILGYCLSVVGLVAPVIIHFNHSGKFSVFAVLIGVALSVFVLYLLHVAEMRTGFIASIDGIQTRDHFISWKEVAGVQTVTISKPGQRGPSHYIRIILKNGSCRDLSMNEVFDRFDNIPVLVKAYWKKSHHSGSIAG